MSTYDVFGRTWERAEATFWRWLKLDYGLPGLAISLLVYVVAAGVLLQSGVFIVGVMLNDTLLVTETGYRIAHGQCPGIDFTSTPGALWFLPHAIAFIVTGDLVRSVPIAFVVF